MCWEYARESEINEEMVRIYEIGFDWVSNAVNKVEMSTS